MTKSRTSASKPPFEVGHLVAATCRVPPFMSDDVLVVKELQNLGTKTKPHWRVRVASLARRGHLGAPARMGTRVTEKHIAHRGGAS